MKARAQTRAPLRRTASGSQRRRPKAGVAWRRTAVVEDGGGLAGQRRGGKEIIPITRCDSGSVNHLESVLPSYPEDSDSNPRGNVVSHVLIQHYLNELSDLKRVSGSKREMVVREAFKTLLKGWGLGS
jgi:hypothetical protein